jgi:hypothetical protein
MRLGDRFYEGEEMADHPLTVLTFAQLVDSIRADSELTQSIKSYSGKEVEIRGFIVPAGPPDLSFFMLSRVSALGNYCCEVPVGQDETVFEKRRGSYFVRGERLSSQAPRSAGAVRRRKTLARRPRRNGGKALSE